MLSANIDRCYNNYTSLFIVTHYAIVLIVALWFLPIRPSVCSRSDCPCIFHPRSPNSKTKQVIWAKLT